MPNRTLSILLVDSEESIHQSVGTYLKEAGHQVDNTRDSDGTLEALARTDYDLMLMSLLVPGLDARTHAACPMPGITSGDADCCAGPFEPVQR